MENILLKFVNEQLPIDREDQQISAQDDLLGGSILDSLGMMKLILYIENEFDIKVPPEDMTIENFINIETICGYIKNK